MTIRSMKAYEMHADFCKLFSNPIRLALLDVFREGDKTVTQLQKLLHISQSTVSQHLAMLRRLGMVKTHKEGRKVYYGISDERLLKAYDLVDQIVRERRTAEAKILQASTPQ
ncbi:MAG: metalloregulator ArsR/SmtB family transcription factor [Nitrososphaerota archaeon]